MKRKSKKNRMLGGEFIGCGAYGQLYARPRLPCAADANGSPAETLSDVLRPEEITQVGKLFKNEIQTKIDETSGETLYRLYNYSNAANKEMETIDRLQWHLPAEVTIDVLNQYFVFPIKKCQINRDELNQPPYNTPEWKKCNSGLYSKKAFKSDGSPLPDIMNTMVVYKLGGSDINNIIQNTYNNPITDIKFIHNLINLTNVLEGIQLLQRYDFIYGDLKPTNIINMDGVFKLGDVGDIRHIPTTADMAAMPFAFQYIIWPSISLYSYFFSKGNLPPNTAPAKIRLIQNNQPNKELSEAYKLYKMQERFNNNSIQNDLYPNLVEPFSITEDLGFTPEQVSTAHKYAVRLLGDKLFHYNSHRHECNRFDKFNNALIHNDADAVQYVAYLDNIMGSFSTVDELKLDLLKRIDVYSIGMLLLTCVGEHIKYKKSIPEGVNRRVINTDAIIRLYDLIFECCVQESRCANIMEIVTKYMQITNDLHGTYINAQRGYILNTTASSSGTGRLRSHSLDDDNALAMGSPAIGNFSNSVWGDNNTNGW